MGSVVSMCLKATGKTYCHRHNRTAWLNWLPGDICSQELHGKLLLNNAGRSRDPVSLHQRTAGRFASLL